ncbi:MAG: DUF3500 domain-containing protein [Actinobacteria bacterium]|nr:MAG: DUF3500 domain-containing protein [Actinomycetota bacterium]
MRAAALAFLDSLADEQRGLATFGFDDDRRATWHYRPVDRSARHGVRLADLAQPQRNLAHRMVQTALSRHAYSQVAAIVALEDVLDALEGHRRGRNSGNYFVALYGEPGGEDAVTPWGWRFEGHHVSVNLALVGGEVAPTPLFLGANPAESAVRPLAGEEDLARSLLHALDPDQRVIAVVAGEAPGDILTTNVPAVAGPLEPAGIAGGDLHGVAREALAGLVALYAGRVPDWKPPPVDEVLFAWAGEPERRRPHYYRLQAPGFLVEYDNTQDGANHVHTVWRDPDGDFGRDLLRAHLAEHHA